MKIFSLAICVVLICVSCKAQNKTLPEGQTSSHTKLIDSASNKLVKFALLCHTSTEQKSQHNLKSIDLTKTEGQTEVCIDSSTAVTLNPNKFWIKPISQDEIYIEIPCQNRAGFEHLLRKMPAGNKMALYVEDTALVTYGYTLNQNYSDRCGIFSESSLQGAFDICTSMMNAVGKDPEQCGVVCDANKNETMKDICMVANAEKWN